VKQVFFTLTWTFLIQRYMNNEARIKLAGVKNPIRSRNYLFFSAALIVNTKNAPHRFSDIVEAL